MISLPILVEIPVWLYWFLFLCWGIIAVGGAAIIAWSWVEYILIRIHWKKWK